MSTKRMRKTAPSDALVKKKVKAVMELETLDDRMNELFIIGRSWPKLHCAVLERIRAKDPAPFDYMFSLVLFDMPNV